jgi:integrase
MPLKKRGTVWWVDFVAPSGERVRRSTGTEQKAQAQEYYDRLRADLWRVSKFGEQAERTWNEAVARWLTEQSHKATIETDKIHLRWLHPHLNGKALTAITRARIDRITELKKAEGVRNATVNRVLEVLRAILVKCVNEWEWLDRAPQVRMLHEAERPPRFLTRDEAQRLLTELPPHLADMAAFSLATGLRRANVTGLPWAQIDVERRTAYIRADQAKGRRAIPVPLNADAIAIILKQVGKHPELVFSYRGHPIRQVNTKAWAKALARAGIENFRWHDLRHTWASWLAQDGVPQLVLQELGGWRSSEMVRRYAHLSAEHLAPFAERLSGRGVLPPTAEPPRPEETHTGGNAIDSPGSAAEDQPE